MHTACSVLQRTIACEEQLTYKVQAIFSGPKNIENAVKIEQTQRDFSAKWKPVLFLSPDQLWDHM